MDSFKWPGDFCQLLLLVSLRDSKQPSVGENDFHVAKLGIPAASTKFESMP
jgi:hypothetical protein